ncbi:MAG: SMC-Scp complex subunit ScpB [Candidatus Paceibacterota bacterium]|jgi:segregation and condensation protein B
MTLSAKIESILFFKSEPLSRATLAKLTNTNTGLIDEAIEELKTKLTDRGLVILEKGDEVMLGTAPEYTELIEGLIKEELSRDLGKAGLETLAIVIYEGPLSRAEIDYVRGVNSSFILRHMLVRGLVERLPKPGDARTFLYGPTFDLLKYLGVAKIEDLPEYDTIRQELKTFKEAKSESNEDNQNHEIPTSTTESDSLTGDNP